MDNKILKRVTVKAIFPGGREVKGWTASPPKMCDENFQVWISEKEDGSETFSAIVNPRLAESVELTFQYEKLNIGK